MEPREEFEASLTHLTRRRFLGHAGVVAAGAVIALRLDLLLDVQAAPLPTGLPAFPGAFGRIFPTLPPFAPASDAIKAALLDIGKPGGVLDAKDDLSQGPAALITDPALSVKNPNNVTHTAGTTFMGQFMDHDMTFDATSPLGQPTDPTTARNSRTAAFDLDSVYGLGPLGIPHLYDPRDPVKFRIGFGGLFEDLPRQMDLDGTSNHSALIGDPRNDENLMIAGLHAAFLKFHNRVVDHVRGDGHSRPAEVFLRARLLTTWHYQWMIVHEFLPLFVGQQLVDDILRNGARFFKPKNGRAFIPVEFQTGTYRFGHSMVRPSYRANLQGDNGGPFFGFVFDPSQHPEDASQPPLADPNDMAGGARAPRRFVGWQTFFDFGDGQVKPNKLIDTTISTPLFMLPLLTIASHTPPVALPQRNLLRHLTWSLPSGQAIAKRMGITLLEPQHFPELAPYGLGLESSTPLFYYILREAGLTETTQPTLVPSPPPTPTTTGTGLRLGPVGGRIVAEVILGLLRADPTSYLSADPRWRPTLPIRSGATGDFRMVDFLTFAGVDPTSRGQ
jgi:Animal haem peroxidase